MAKLARENKLRERRQDKEARKEARRQASAEDHEPQTTEEPADQLGPEPSDPRAKEVALNRLRDSPDEELAVFESTLQDRAREAGATEQEIRSAQLDAPEPGA